jgi:4-alpha-glucanotransferase
MSFIRSSGILLHITSLPGGYGIGDFGPMAYRFVDFLAVSKQGLWQILPLTPTGFGDSPYQSYSAFAGNTNFISPDLLVADGLLSEEDLQDAPQTEPDRVNFGAVIEFKNRILAQAFNNFRRADNAEAQEAFNTFCQTAAYWLNDYALFRALLKANHYAVWTTWAPGLARREAAALQAAQEAHQGEILAQMFYQFLFFKQWQQLKTYAKEHGVKIIGDMPIFVAHNSADVWANPQLFKLNEDGSAKVVAGVPPDYFSEDGQLWGNPIYDWDAMREEHFAWWLARMQATLELVDIVRIDHFRGLAATWEVPANEPTAKNGTWVEVPGEELLIEFEKAFLDLPILAEDLGMITPDVESLRDDFGIPGMKILQFGLGGDARNKYLPHHYHHNCAVYTGTHDNDTVVGWYEDRLSGEKEYAARERSFCLRYLHSDGSEIHWDFIRAALSSVATLAIVQLQDLLGLDSSARMNLPATEAGNWTWRAQAEMFSKEVSDRLREMTELYGRSAR